MAQLFELVALLLLSWRTALVTAISVFLAVVLAAFMPAFTGVAGIVLVFIGFGGGLLWETASNPQPVPTAATSTQEVSWPVAVLGLAFLGALIGGLTSAVAGSALVGAASLLCGVAAVAFHRSQVAKRPIPIRSLAISSISLLVGLGVLLLLGALQEKPTSNPAYMDSPRSQEN
ncbi:MAG: hypothetical protein HS110_15120 [Zoogloeaceae bacterium]|jgi:hypothetical protein|nr:hypothetical protein [Zoogloeaceae bacterium]